MKKISRIAKIIWLSEEFFWIHLHVFFKLDKHAVLLLNWQYSWLVNQDFLASHRREILYTQTDLFEVEKKNTLQDVKKVYSLSVIQLILKQT